MRFVVTVGCVSVEASDHEEAANKAVKQLWDQEYVDISVCDMEIGFRKSYRAKTTPAKTDE